MKQITFAKKRILGITLAALTVVAGMSSLAFAGEPNVPMQEFGKSTPAMSCKLEAITINGEDARNFVPRDGVNWVELVKLDLGEGIPEAVTVEAKEIETKVDEETGIKYYSVDGGATWTVLDLNEGALNEGVLKEIDGTNGDVTFSMKTTASVPATAKGDAEQEK